MAQIYAKVQMNDNISKACKMVRKYTSMPIGEIKSKIENGEILLKYDYLNLEELKKMRRILVELTHLGATVSLFREMREVDMNYLNNTIESYEGIEKDIERQDELMFDEE